MSAVAATVKRAGRAIERHGVRHVVWESIERPLRPALAPAAGLRLRRAAAKARTLDEHLDLAFDYAPFGIGIMPGQIRSEIAALLERLAAEPPRRALEIGTWSGGSLFLLTRVATPDAHLISVDLPDGEFGGGYPSWKTPLYRRFTRARQRLDLLRADSHAPATLETVRSLLGGEQLDFLFIDGDHSYEGVRTDFESYSTLVRPGGLIAFHDIAAPPTGDTVIAEDGSLLMVGGVPAYWDEVRARYPGAEEFVGSTDGCFGIGLVRV